MTTYGTITTSPSRPIAASPSRLVATSPSKLAPNLDYISKSNQRSRSGFATRRPWKEMLNHLSFSLPSTYAEAIGRLRTNLDYFLTNYSIVMLLILFLSLLWHPLSLIVLTGMFALWLYFYFLRDEKVVIFDFLINDRVILIVLSVLTICFLVLTGVKMNVLLSIVVGLVLVLAHAIFRKISDLFQHEESINITTHLLIKK